MSNGTLVEELRDELCRFHGNGVITLGVLPRDGAPAPALCDAAVQRLGFDALAGRWTPCDRALALLAEILSRSDIWCAPDLERAEAERFAARIVALLGGPIESAWSNGRWFDDAGAFDSHAVRRSIARRRAVASMQDMGVVLVSADVVVVFWYEE